jgi:hypothetical protein
MHLFCDTSHLIHLSIRLAMKVGEKCERFQNVLSDQLGLRQLCANGMTVLLLVTTTQQGFIFLHQQPPPRYSTMPV